MHRSRLRGLIIDCQTDDLESAGEFWTKALGYEPKDSSLPEDGGYIPLKTGPDDPDIELQQVTHPSIVHLDIETDDVEAEVSRLEELGANRKGERLVSNGSTHRAPILCGHCKKAGL